jgi:hypothetical protein
MSLGVLQDRIGATSLTFGGPINANLARRIACDAPGHSGGARVPR